MMPIGVAWQVPATRSFILQKSRDEACVAETRSQLESLGPYGLWLEAVRGWLKDHGFVQASDESFAETTSRALGIGIDELRVSIAQGQIVSALLERFCEVR
jgi:hypothetical protein